MHSCIWQLSTGTYCRLAYWYLRSPLIRSPTCEAQQRREITDDICQIKNGPLIFSKHLIIATDNCLQCSLPTGHPTICNQSEQQHTGNGWNHTGHQKKNIHRILNKFISVRIFITYFSVIRHSLTLIVKLCRNISGSTRLPHGLTPHHIERHIVICVYITNYLHFFTMFLSF